MSESAQANDDDAVAVTTTARPLTLSVTGLLLGLIALALATVPSLAFDRPLPNPFVPDTEPKELPKPVPPADPEGGLTVKFKDFSFNIGGKKKKAAPEPIPEPEPQPEVTSDPVRLFTISAIGSALIGIVFSAIGQFKEHHTSLTVSAMGCCVAAMTWQYFAAGIMIGAGIAIFLIVIAALGSAMG